MKKDPIKIQAHVVLGFLIIQFLFGMVANLFVQFPNTTNKKTLWEFAQTQWSVSVHMIIALLLIIGGIVFLIRTIRRKDKKWIIASSIGLFGILIATITGIQFISTQQGGYSYAMAVAFIISFVSYGWGIYKTK